MLQSITYALASAWLFTLLLGVMGYMPRRPSGRPAVISTAGALLLISWAGGLWGRLLLGLDAPHPFPYVFAGMMGAIALAPLAIPFVPADPRLPRGLKRPCWVTIPSASYWALVLTLVIAIVVRYGLECLA